MSGVHGGPPVIPALKAETEDPRAHWLARLATSLSSELDRENLP